VLRPGFQILKAGKKIEENCDYLYGVSPRTTENIINMGEDLELRK
jgi:hypothetical protein